MQIISSYNSLSVTEYFPFLKHRREVNLCMILYFQSHLTTRSWTSTSIITVYRSDNIKMINWLFTKNSSLGTKAAFSQVTQQRRTRTELSAELSYWHKHKPSRFTEGWAQEVQGNFHLIFHPPMSLEKHTTARVPCMQHCKKRNMGRLGRFHCHHLMVSPDLQEGMKGRKIQCFTST